MAKTRAFSLIEILVVMAIIAVLLALVAFGISVSQRNSRDSQRGQTAASIQLGVEEYNSLCGRYPQNSDFVVSSTQITMKKPASSSCNPQVIPLSGPTTAATSVTASGTQYAYSYDANDDSYVIGVGLESGGWNTSSSSKSNPKVGQSDVLPITGGGGNDTDPMYTPTPGNGGSCVAAGGQCSGSGGCCAGLKCYCGQTCVDIRFTGPACQDTTPTPKVTPTIQPAPTPTGGKGIPEGGNCSKGGTCESGLTCWCGVTCRNRYIDLACPQ